MVAEEQMAWHMQILSETAKYHSVELGYKIELL